MAEKFMFHSVLAPYIQRLVEAKESAGLSALRLKWILKEFDDFAAGIGLTDPHITSGLIEQWRKTRIADADSTLYSKYSAWAQLTRMMSRNGVACYVPRLPKEPESDFEPYIFTHEQISRIFEEADKWRLYDIRMGTALISMPVLIRLLYSTGMRVSEALSIKNEDINMDEGFIILHKTKNGSERIVALSESMKIGLRQFMEYRDRMPLKDVDSPHSPLFIKSDGTPFTQGTVYTHFKKLLAKCGIPHLGNHQGPRVHDLRHTSAVHAMVQIARSGQDVYVWLPALSASLGHHSIASTEMYVRLTKAMYPDITDRCSALNDFVFPKICPMYDDYCD